MLGLKPIPENRAAKEISTIYKSIKQTFGLANVPLIFQYLAVFPDYLDFIWQQAVHNLSNPEFKNQAQELEKFAQTAISSFYTPQTLTKLFLEKIEGTGEKLELIKFVATVSAMNASLFLLSLAIRESLKGRYLGIKQIEERLEEKERQAFNDISEGFYSSAKFDKRNTDIGTISEKGIIASKKQAITVSLFAQFFDIMDKEMEKLVKEEKYLTRRVELERFTLGRLHLIPHPLDSSITAIFNKAYDHPKFPELIYLVSDLFPTQTPFKLMASAVMKESLIYSPNRNIELL